jgi:hypothetical protein
VKARQLIGNASYGPDVLKVLYQAFDEAWARLAPSCGSDPQAIEAARTQLADVILALAKDRAKPDVDELVESALVVLGQTGRD